MFVKAVVVGSKEALPQLARSMRVGVRSWYTTKSLAEVRCVAGNGLDQRVILLAPHCTTAASMGARRAQQPKGAFNAASCSVTSESRKLKPAGK